MSKAVLDSFSKSERDGELRGGDSFSSQLSSVAQLEFTLASLGASLALPLGVHTSKQVMEVFRLYRTWLLVPSQRPPALADEAQTQRFIQRLVLQLSQLVAVRPDQDGAGTSDQVALVRFLLRLLLALTREQSLLFSRYPPSRPISRQPHPAAV